MILSPNETHFLIWAAFTMVTILGFIGAFYIMA